MLPNEVDYFNLHTRKPKNITVEMLDYDYVDKCTDLDELKGILAMLRSGKEGRYFELEKTTENKILSILPEKERHKILTMQREPSAAEISSAENRLHDFTQAINEKRERLLSTKKSNRTLPPVRGKSDPTDTPIQSELLDEGKTKKMGNAIPGYDFRAWQKYDVDKALEEIDEQAEEAKRQAEQQRIEIEKRSNERKKELASLPAYINLDEMPAVEREIYATREKQKGNECFKAGETEESIVYYTRSIAFDDNNAIVYANRALSYLRLKNFQNAEEDCTRSVKLDPQYVKAWSRRGMTRHRRGNYAGAVLDFEKALSLDPNNKEIPKLLKKTKDTWKEVEGERFSRLDIVEEEEDSQNPVNPGNKRIEIISERSHEPTHENTKDNDYQRVGKISSGYTRMSIEEDEDDEDDDLEQYPQSRFEVLED